MKWLRHSMDHIATIINIEDKPTEDPQVDTLKVSDYIANFLKKSSLHRFLKRDTEPKLSKYKERGESIIELYSKKEKSENAPGFMELVEYLQELCQTVFSKPQRSMRQQLRISKPVLICEGKLDQSIIKVLESDKRHPESDKAPVAYMILYAAQDAEKFSKLPEFIMAPGYLLMRI